MFQDPSIEVHGQNRKVYRIRVRVPIVDIATGKVVRTQKPVTLGVVGEITLAEAKRRKQSILATINAGSIVTQSQIPFGALVDKFVEIRLPQLATTTRQKYKHHIDNTIKAALGELKLCEIDRAVVESLLVSKAGLSKATRLDIRNIISAIFEQARAWKLWSGENPARGANVGRGGPVREKRAMSPDSIRLFLDSLPEQRIISITRARLLARCAIATGLRVSELLGLQYADVDALNETITVARRVARGDIDQPKSAASRRVRYCPFVRELLALRAPNEPVASWVFHRDGEPLDDRDLQQYVWRPAATLAGIYRAGFGLHTLRRLAITWRQHQGATLAEAMKFAGHTRLDTTLLYTLEDERRERDATARVAALLEAPVAGDRPS